MRTVGLLGGMSAESTTLYYQAMNRLVRERLGGLHSARSLMLSVDFAEIEELQRAGDWQTATNVMIAAAQALERGGADFVVICTNTMHKMASAVAASISIPLLHIADATAQQIRADGLDNIGLLGTRFTMEEDFYKGRLIEQFGLKVLLPDAAERETVHRIIYDELVVGKILPESKAAYRRIIDNLVSAGAQGIILGCTEIGLLVKPEDSPVPVYDTTRIHAEAAVDLALEN